MGNIKLVGIHGIRIEPDGAGYRVLGEFRPTLPGAIRYAQEYEVPEEQDINDSMSAQMYEDECLDHRLDRKQDADNNIAERRMREI